MTAHLPTKTQRLVNNHLLIKNKLLILLFMTLFIPLTALMPLSALAETISNTAKNKVQRLSNKSPDVNYSGELISLSYHDVPLRDLLAELAAFLGLNLITDDSVQGNVTLHLDDVPSDQALEILLISQGLASRQQGKVLLVATTSRFINLEQQQQDASPLKDAFIKIYYANAQAIRNLILEDQAIESTKAAHAPITAMAIAPDSTATPDEDTLLTSALNRIPFLQPEKANLPNTPRFLSNRGHLLVDERTNALYVRDTAEQVERIKEIIKILDVAVDQVMIEARIVIARTGVSEQLGVSWGARTSSRVGKSKFEHTKTPLGTINGENSLKTTRGTSINLDPSRGANFGFVSSKLLLDLELAALETENRSEIISRPKVITADRNKAVIRSGEEIPYTSITKDGGSITKFRRAELRLEVTPQIIGDGRIVLNLQVNNDSKGEYTQGAAGYTINTKAVETQVLVNNGETIVIGGIFTSQKLQFESKIPILGDIPLIGWLFRNSISEQEKVELLIFITPRMINNTLAKNNAG